MSKPFLKIDPNNSFGGTVLLSHGNGWIRPTGVFVPDAGFTNSHEVVTLILWFHGHFVQDAPHLFYNEATKVIQAVIDSKRDVILVAPELGWYQNSKQSTYDAGALGGGKRTEQYLDQILATLSDWYVDTFIAGEVDEIGGRPPAFRIADLYVAGHSGGGVAIKSSVAALGGYRDTLRECWGFDCLYGDGQSWFEWARSLKGMPLYFYYGTGTQPDFNGDVLGFWRRVYGTPSTRSRPPGG